MAYKTLIFIASLSLVLVLSEKHKNYGSFNLVLTRIDMCKGPKRRDCSVNSITINNSIIMDVDMLVTENISPTKGKVLTIANGIEILRLQINKPCDNLFVKPVFRTFFNATHECVIKKGHYVFSMDFQQILRNYYGGMHLYGLYAFKATFYADQCNFSCVNIEVKITGND